MLDLISGNNSHIGRNLPDFLTSRVAVTTTSSRVTSFSCAERQSGNKIKKAEQKIEIKRLIETSSAHQMGLKNFVWPALWQAGLARRSERFAQAGRRVQKKSPAFASKTGDFTRLHPSQSYPRRPLREEYPGRFSDSPDLNSPSHPELARRAVAFLLRHLSRI